MIETSVWNFVFDIYVIPFKSLMAPTNLQNHSMTSQTKSFAATGPKMRRGGGGGVFGGSF